MATNPSPTMDNTEKNGKYRLLLNEDLNCNTVNFGIKEHQANGNLSVAYI